MQSPILRFLGLSLVAVTLNAPISRAEETPAQGTQPSNSTVESPKPQEQNVKSPEKPPVEEVKKDTKKGKSMASKRHKGGKDHGKDQGKDQKVKIDSEIKKSDVKTPVTGVQPIK